MSESSISQLIDNDQLNAALQTIDGGEHVASNVSTAHACKLIRYMVGRGMLKRAVSLAEVYLEQNLDDAEVHFLLGNTALKLGDVEKALIHLERANSHHSKQTADSCQSIGWL